MPIEIEALIAPVFADAPCGPDLEYDPDFTALEQAARGKREQQVGDKIVPAEEPDWGDVRRRAESLFSRTKDIRVAMLFTRAQTRGEDIVGPPSRALWQIEGVVYSLLGLYTPDILTIGLLGLVPTLLALMVGIHLRGRLDQRRFRQLILVLLVLSVANLLWRSFGA